MNKDKLTSCLANLTFSLSLVTISDTSPQSTVIISTFGLELF